MWLRLNLEGIEFFFKVKEYIKDQIDFDDSWTKISFSFELPNILKYSKHHEEILENCEVNEIRDSLCLLLDNKMEQETTYQPIEPDLEFVLRPKSKYTDIDMELKVHLWDDGTLTCNYFSVDFDREDIEALYTYLCLVTGKINIEHPKVQELIKGGVILKYE